MRKLYNEAYWGGAAVRAVPDKNNRPNLSFMRVTVEPHAMPPVVIDSTDGHRVSRTRLPGRALATAGDYYLPAGLLPFLVAATRGDEGDVAVSRCGERCTARGRKGAWRWVVGGEGPRGTFPPFDQVIPSGDRFSASLDLSPLARLRLPCKLEAVATLAAEGEDIRMVVRGRASDDPVMFSGIVGHTITRFPEAIRLNAVYLRDATKHNKGGGVITLRGDQKLSAWVIHAEEHPDHVHAIAPLPQ